MIQLGIMVDHVCRTNTGSMAYDIHIYIHVCVVCFKVGLIGIVHDLYMYIYVQDTCIYIIFHSYGAYNL